MNSFDTLRLDKTVFSVASLHDDSDERAHWGAKTPYERLAAIELMRRINYGDASATARLQRVLEITQLASG